MVSRPTGGRVPHHALSNRKGIFLATSSRILLHLENMTTRSTNVTQVLTQHVVVETWSPHFNDRGVPLPRLWPTLSDHWVKSSLEELTHILHTFSNSESRAMMSFLHVLVVGFSVVYSVSRSLDPSISLSRSEGEEEHEKSALKYSELKHTALAKLSSLYSALSFLGKVSSDWSISIWKNCLRSTPTKKNPTIDSIIYIFSSLSSFPYLFISLPTITNLPHIQTSISYTLQTNQSSQKYLP